MDHALHHLAEQIRSAVADKRRLRVQGALSKRFLWSDSADTVLDTRPLGGIRSYEPSELVVTAGAGTALAELEAALAAQGQCLPFEPPHLAWGEGAAPTVGGMVASALAGPARASVGGVRDYVLGVQMLNGQGQHLVFGGQVMKNVAGYDVSRLMAGSWGSLGVLTEVSLKVLPVAAAEATLCFELDQVQALERLHGWGGRPLPLNASCWVHDTTSPGAAQCLFVRLRGAAAAVAAASQQMLAEVPGTPVDPAQAQADWQRCRDQQLPFFQQRPSDAHALWRLSVAQTTPVLPLPAAPLIEWHGALRWVWAGLEHGAALQALCQQHGGHATLWLAPLAGALPLPARWATAPAATRAVAQRLRASFDPHGVFACHPAVAHS